MRFLAKAMYVAGIILFCILALFLLIIFVEVSEQGAGPVIILSIVFALMFGVPGYLLIFFSNRIKKTLSPQPSNVYRQPAAPVAAPIPAPAPGSGRKHEVITKSVSRSTRTFSATTTSFGGGPVSISIQNNFPGGQTEPKKEKDAAPRTVICQSCGAPTNMLSNESKACEYCGTIKHGQL